MTLSARPPAEMLRQRACPRGCGQEVLVGDDGVTFEPRPRWVLEHPRPERLRWRPYSGFEEGPQAVRVVDRQQLWFEHVCAAARPSP